MQCHIAVNYEATKAGRCVEPSRIIMLPDVWMAKTYSKRLEAGNWGPGLLESHGMLDPCSWTFSTSWTVHCPYISPCFCRKHFTGLVSVHRVQGRALSSRCPIALLHRVAFCSSGLEEFSGVPAISAPIHFYRNGTISRAIPT